MKKPRTKRTRQRRPELSALAPDVRSARLPRTRLASALHEKVHRDTGKSRPVASVKRQLGTLMMYGALAVGVVILALGVSLKVQTSRLNAVRAEYSTFKAQVAVLGEQAKLVAKQREAADRKSKERADNEHKRTTDNLRADIKRLRSARPGGGVVPAAPAGAEHPEVAAFNRAELELALRNFEIGIEGLLVEGDEAIVDLNSAKTWAQEMK